MWKLKLYMEGNNCACGSNSFSILFFLTCRNIMKIVLEKKREKMFNNKYCIYCID